jgi:hypothetical protein
MGRLQKWQRGATDLVSIVASMTILSIAVAGTSAAMIYGREALLRTEHYKVAAFRLRGTVEQMSAEVQLDTNATNNGRRRAERLDTLCALDDPHDRNGRIGQIAMCRITRGEVVPYQIYDFGSSDGLYYYRIQANASWTEFDDVNPHRIAFETSVLTREPRTIRN